MKNVDQAAGQYYRLILLVGPSCSGKTTTLQEIHRRTEAPLINANLELARRMLDLTDRQRALRLPRILADLVAVHDADLVLLDNFEILFDTSLKQDPLKILQSISRNQTMIAAWNGSVKDGQLIYAEPDHPEYKRYPAKDFLSVAMAPKE
ncbi:BREX-3 system P-loop-containing protein BrxF [Desulfatibacillum alkenivorans]|nr:BREX-3 system P-loop-containing protein BrxF [Desulfatibacillum alkenivorans]